MLRFTIVCLMVNVWATARADDRPNVVVIMADDVGWGDLGSYGGGPMRGAPTPELDRMAREGTRFTSFYAHPTCTPTRASLMTGRLPIRAGFTLPLFPGLPMGLHPDEITIAEVIGPSGYSTAVFGKWHLGDLEIHLPHKQGFDEFWGFLYHCDAYLYPTDRDWRPDSALAKQMKIRGIVEGKKGEASQELEPITAERLKTLDRDLAERSVAYINDHSDDENPFFLFVGFAKAHYKNFPHPDFAGKSESGDYGDALMEMDYHSGMILQAVRDAGIAPKTLVLWMSDNGPSIDTFPDSGFTPFRGAKGSTYEGGMRQPCIAWWPGTVPENAISDGLFTTMDVFTTVASLAGATIPTDRPIDGHDQTAFLKGTGQSATDTVYYYSAERLAAIRHGKWKCHFVTIEDWPNGGYTEHSAPPLYDLKTDPGETHNLVFTKTWEVVQANLLRRQHLAEVARFPNREILR